MPFMTRMPFPAVSTLIVLVATMADVTACAKVTKPSSTTPLTPIDFVQALQYAQRSALVYESHAAIRQKMPAGTTVSIIPETAAGVKSYVEIDDAKKV